MSDKNSEPAEAFRKERAKTKSGGKDDELDEGLEDTFPASDPVSPTRNDRLADKDK